MDAFKRNIQGFRKSGRAGRKSSGMLGPRHTGGMGGPCACCVETDKRGRSRLARRRLRQIDQQDAKDE